MTGVEGTLHDELFTFFSGFTLQLKPSRGMVLWGPPGTGKTTILLNLVPYCGFSMPAALLGGTDLLSSYVTLVLVSKLTRCLAAFARLVRARKWFAR